MQQKQSVKEKWLNVMLHFSSFINSYKLKLVETNGPKIILYGFFILLLELVNFFISLPAYAFIKPEFFAGGDQNAVRTYRLRRIVSLSVLGGMVLAVMLWIVVGVFGVALFPGTSHASTASWDFNNSLAYHYDPTKIQIVDGTVVFKATQAPIVAPVDTGTTTPTTEEVPTTDTSTPDSTTVPSTNTDTTTTTPIIETAPTTEPAPTPVVEPAPEPAPAPAPEPVAPTSPLLFNFIKFFFGTDKALAQGNSCSATLEPIAPLIVASFDHWTSFSEIANNNGGTIHYQLSTDSGVTWQYFDGSSWITASTDNYNTANDINDNINTLPTTLSTEGVATLSFRAQFTSDCTQDVTLLSLTADYAEHTTIVEVTSPTETNIIQTTTSEEDPGVIAVTESVASVTTDTTEDTSIVAPSIPATVPITDTTTTTNSTSLDTSANVETPTTDTTSVNVNQDTSLDTNTTVTTPLVVPIPFSVHMVITTTGTPGHTLYSVPELFTLEEGPDNGLVVKVTNTNLEQTTLTTGNGASGNVSVGDHIVVLTYDGSDLKLYVDGAVSATLNAPIVIAPPAQVSTSIGCVSAGVVLEALTLAQINANYIQCGNQAPIININNASQKQDDSFVDINYTIIDQENNFVTLSKYEFSLTGTFAGEQLIMTEASLDTDSNGTGGLTGSTSGTSHTLVWNVEADLPNTSGNVYIRLKGTDGLLSSTNETFGPFRIDTKAPVVTSISGTQQSDSDTVAINYKVSDVSTPVTVSIELSNDNGVTWIVPTTGATGSLGEITNANGTTNYIIFWDAGVNLPEFEGDVEVSITAIDKYGNTSITESDSMAVDTRDPFGLANFEGLSSNENEIMWHWSPAGGELNFSHYTITYGTDIAEVTAGTGASVHTWGSLRDSDMSIVGTDRTIITGLTVDTRYYAKITAYDDFGHEATSLVAFFNTKARTINPENTPSEEITTILSDTATLPPTVLTGGFKIKINSGSVSTESKDVTLTLTAGEDTALMAISNHSDLADAALVAYTPTTAWDLCEGLEACENGTYTVYVKYYTSFGVGSTLSKVSDSITLLLPTEPANTETETTGDASSSAPENNSIGDIISSIISDIFGGSDNTVETTIPDNADNLANTPNTPQVLPPVSTSPSDKNSDVKRSSGGGNSNTRNTPSPVTTTNTNTSAQSPSASNPSKGTITTKIVPTSTTAAFSGPALQSLSQARESAVIAKPTVNTVNKSITGGSITFLGKGIPKSKVALFIHTDQVVVYTTDVNEKGEWSFKHDQGNVELAPGEHSVFAVTYDPGSKVKSKPSLVETFEVKQNTAAVILSYMDLPTTLLTLLACIFGAVYIGTRKRKAMR